MWIATGIIVASLWAIAIWLGLITVRLRNLTSSRPSPIPPTTPTPPSDTDAETVARTAIQEMRLLATELSLGRPQVPTTTEPVMWPTSNVRPDESPSDWVPGLAGIEAVMERESEEDEHFRLRTRRDELMQQLADLDTRASSNGTSAEAGPTSTGE